LSTESYKRKIQLHAFAKRSHYLP